MCIRDRYRVVPIWLTWIVTMVYFVLTPLMGMAYFLYTVSVIYTAVSYTHLDVYKRQSYDNVVLVYQQMIGAIIKAMMEEKIHISKFMGNGRQAYTTIAEKDTIEEIELFVKGFIGRYRIIWER